ncbi:hypothetical protein CIG19_03025 [Enterobacterales bacterium CwR94]|nr:hypothetical protein CIG19_03025 [Enterobacterales bacterium CwR94]
MAVYQEGDTVALDVAIQFAGSVAGKNSLSLHEVAEQPGTTQSAVPQFRSSAVPQFRSSAVGIY